jgi:aldehyde dehydrogenase (NAD+)
MTDNIASTYDLYISGAWTAATDGGAFETINPSTGEVLAEVAAAGPEDVDKAVESALDGFDEWSGLSPQERSRRLNALADRLRDNRDELAHIECYDQGKPISEAAAGVDTAARYFEFFAGAADKLHGQTYPLNGAWNSKTIRQPRGVSAQITPWNDPRTQLARGTAPALAAGNAVIVKPAEQTPLSALHIGELAIDAGLPSGALNVLPGFGPEAGEPLVTHDDVDVVTFTGSRETGQRVMEQAAKGIKTTTLELGGKGPAIVFPDADLDNAVESVLTGIFQNAGQTCSASSRLLIHESLHDEFVEEFLNRTAALNIGPGIDDPDVGPVTSQDQLEKTQKYIEIGQTEGATLIAGGETLDREGYFLEPTVFDDVTPDMRIANEEIFGPVLSVLTFSDEQEAIDIANDSRYGLVAGIFSRDHGRIERLAREVAAGHIYVNDWYAGGVETPFGGVNESGIGREKGIQAMEHYTNLKTISSGSHRL